MSENTEDMLGDTYAPSIQESRAIKDIYSTKGGDQAMLPTSSTVTMSDFTPVSCMLKHTGNISLLLRLYFALLYKTGMHFNTKLLPTHCVWQIS